MKEITRKDLVRRITNVIYETTDGNIVFLNDNKKNYKNYFFINQKIINIIGKKNLKTKYKKNEIYERLRKDKSKKLFELQIYEKLPKLYKYIIFNIIRKSLFIVDEKDFLKYTGMTFIEMKDLIKNTYIKEILKTYINYWHSNKENFKKWALNYENNNEFIFYFWQHFFIKDTINFEKEIEKIENKDFYEIIIDKIKTNLLFKKYYSSDDLEKIRKIYRTEQRLPIKYDAKDVEEKTENYIFLDLSYFLNNKDLEKYLDINKEYLEQIDKQNLEKFLNDLKNNKNENKK